MVSSDFRPMGTAEYFDRITTYANQAKIGDRLIVQSMSYDHEELLVAKLARALTEAAKRGANVTLIVDAYAFLAGNSSAEPGPWWSRPGHLSKLREPYASRASSLRELAANGGHFTVTNQPTRPFSLIPAGRSHIKYAVFNNQVLVGGCNLGHTDSIDMMVEFVSRSAANWLSDLAKKLLLKPKVGLVLTGKDRLLKLDESTGLLLDAGKPRQSVIYKTALEAIDQAEKSVFITCQYFPGGATGQHLLKAHKRGVQVHILYSRPSVHGKLAPLHYLHNTGESIRLPRQFFKHSLKANGPKLHAKILATDKTLMIGSHNYVSPGVRLGTAELALKRDDPALARQVVRLASKYCEDYLV